MEISPQYTSFKMLNIKKRVGKSPQIFLDLYSALLEAYAKILILLYVRMHVHGHVFYVTENDQES
jgi:hypothetical protein